ncbi:hypothetical protein [Tunicatimonas pelagia]|uniref:hypothetical protein n=1 Tax=Tunicatimonas pelagia TaxID=931531 RepID=UPI002665E407|nr:hypothetical protein [Tunicatimonas pelagia]WKN45295.1 hypothetical protein P0M28_10025 [Tunicatimonas pelagia]
METIIARKYAIIEKLMRLGEEEVAEVEATINQFTEEASIDIEQYNRELEEAEAEIDRGEFYTHKQAMERLSRWKKNEG